MNRYCTFLFSTFLLLLCTNLLQAQANNRPPIVIADTTWGREIIPFPIEWVPEIIFKGYEELRFAPNRADTESDQFWTLVMAWNIETERPLSISEIETALTHYFSGLMQPNHWASEFPEPSVNFSKKENKEIVGIKGNIQFFDGFYTGKTINANLWASQHFCEKKGRTIVVLKFSTKAYEQPIWDVLNSIQINIEICDES